MLSHVLIDGPRSPARDGIDLDQHLSVTGSDEDCLPHESFLHLGVMRYHERDDLNTPFDSVRRKQTYEVFIQLALTWETSFEVNTPYALRATLAAFAYGAFLNAIPLVGIRAAFIAGDIFRHHTLFAMTFHKAQNVAALTLTGETQLVALEAMSGLIEVDNPLSNQPLFPSLRWLCICTTPAQAVLTDGNTAFTHLRTMLQRRVDADQDAVGGLRMLGRLGLFHSEMPDAQVEQLGPLVAHGSVDLLRAEDDVDSEGET